MKNNAIKIKILDPVHCQIMDGRGVSLLRPFLKYEAVYYQNIGRRKIRKTYPKYLIEKNGLFLTGFRQHIDETSKQLNIPIEWIDNGNLLVECNQKKPELPGITFRQDQHDLIQTAITKQRGVLQSPTGSGKTIVALGIMSCFPESKILFLCHTITLITQTVEELKRFGYGDDIGIIGNGEKRWGRITVATVQSLVKISPAEYADVDIVIVDECFAKDTIIKTLAGDIEIQLIKVGDYVFSAIGKARVNKIFNNKVSLNNIVKILKSDGTEIYCSKNHLFFIKGEGWIEAENLSGKFLFIFPHESGNMMLNNTSDKERKKNDCPKNRNRLFTLRKKIFNKSNRIQEILFFRMLSQKQIFESWIYPPKSAFHMQTLWENFNDNSLGGKNKKVLFSGMQKERNKNKKMPNLFSLFQDNIRNAKILFKKMFLQRSTKKQNLIRNNDKNKQMDCHIKFRKNENQQPNEQSKEYRKDDKHQKNKWNFVCLVRRTWGKWKDSCPSIFACNSLGLVNGSCSQDPLWEWEILQANKWVPPQLQSRYWESHTENCNRGGRERTLDEKKYIAGSEERKETQRIRVESVEIYQSGSNDESFKSIVSDKERNQGFVEFYDLEIDKHPSYFADGALVHNCHHISSFSGSYAKVLSSMLAPIRIGFTATMPYLEEAKLALEGFIGPKIGEVTVKELVDIGKLAIPKIKLISVPFNSALGIITRYQDIYSAAIVQNKARNRLIVREAKDIATAGETVLIIVKEIAHGEILVDMGKQLYDLPMEFIQGSTESEQRELIKKALNDKKVKCVIATAVWKEGVNIPALNTVVVAAGGKSEIATLQAIGRGLRSIDGKKEVKIIDFLDPYKYLAQHTIERLSLYVEQGWL